MAKAAKERVKKQTETEAEESSGAGMRGVCTLNMPKFIS
jgi:hypothetical protein